MPAMTGVARSTTTTEPDRGVIEYRLNQPGSATVVVFHGGHMNAGLALGEDRETLIELFSGMRSGHGFLNGLAVVPDTAGKVTQPTLVIASLKDGSVSYRPRRGARLHDSAQQPYRE